MWMKENRMITQSKMKALGEIKIELKNYQKEVLASNDVTNVKRIAIQIEDYLSKPLVIQVIPQKQARVVLERAAKVRLLNFDIKPYQVQKSIAELQQELHILLENLPGDPDTDPDFPWEG
jgi:hypothetical protein